VEIIFFWYQLPSIHFAGLWLLYSYYFVAIKQTQGIESQLELSHLLAIAVFDLSKRAYLSHCINSSLPQLMVQVISLHQPNTMFACDSTLHFYSPLHHTMNDFFSLLTLLVIVQHHSYRKLARPEIQARRLTVKVSISNVTHDSCEHPTFRYIVLRLLNDIWQSRDWNGYVASPNVIGIILSHRHY
jgi:hypothetical protein